MARLPGGYFKAQGRADDTMNLGGIKVSSLEIERVVEHHPAVYEAAAVAVQPEGEGAEKLVVFAVLSGAAEVDKLQQELGAVLARELNPLFKLHDLVLIDSLPRTASNKLMRRELRAQYAGK
jgi:acetyl-CoA synthetase